MGISPVCCVCVYVYVDVYDGVYVDMNANKKHN